MKKYLVLIAIFSPFVCHGGTLTISNNANTPMSLDFYYNCLDITPDKFVLQPHEGQVVTITPDENNQCQPIKHLLQA